MSDFMTLVNGCRNNAGKTQSSIKMRLFKDKRKLREKINKIYY